MKRLLPFFVAAAFCSTILLAKTPSRTVDFSGNWALDFGQTKNPPPGLQNYSMAVTQDGKQLKVETSLKGEMQTERRANAPSPRQGGGRRGGGYPGGGYPGGGYPGGGYPGRVGVGGGMGRVGFPMPGVGGGMGRRRGGGGGSDPRTVERGNRAAYRLYPKSAVYDLDGSSSTAQFGDPDSTDATSKANWAKGGTLKFTLVGNNNGGQKSGKIQVKDKWKLAENGQYLLVDRDVHSPAGSSKVHLVFRKQAADSNKSDE